MSMATNWPDESDSWMGKISGKTVKCFFILFFCPNNKKTKIFPPIISIWEGTGGKGNDGGR